MIKISPCSHEAAKYAVENWHYTKSLPAAKIIKFGVWEDEKFIGVVIYARGASKDLGTKLGLDQIQVCELARVAFTEHKVEVSKVVAETIKQLKKDNPKMRAIISFADRRQGHKGGIYQAGNWIHTGASAPTTEYFINNRWNHAKTVEKHPETKTCPRRKAIGKLRYIYPLDKAMRRQVMKLALPYPSAVEDSMVSRVDSFNEGKVRTLPTALSDSDNARK